SWVRMTFIVVAPSRNRSAGRARVRQQGHLARVLDGIGDEALFLHGHTGDPTRTDLAAVGDELAQQCGVLVVDVLDLRRLERVGLLLGLANGGLGHRGALLLPELCGRISTGLPGMVSCVVWGSLPSMGAAPDVGRIRRGARRSWGPGPNHPAG